ncbi:MAG: ASCH domain-containing protein [Blastocatellia bacterium]
MKISVTTSYQHWYFGNSEKMSKQLCELVLTGKKTATASLQWVYENKPEDLPIQNGYSIITDFQGKPKCIIQTINIDIVAFNKVSEEFASKEGEGDLSLKYWRDVHWAYFSKECQEIGRQPRQDMPIICEEFKLVYKSLVT